MAVTLNNQYVIYGIINLVKSISIFMANADDMEEDRDGRNA